MRLSHDYRAKAHALAGLAICTCLRPLAAACLSAFSPLTPALSPLRGEGDARQRLREFGAPQPRSWASVNVQSPVRPSGTDAGPNAAMTKVPSTDLLLNNCSGRRYMRHGARRTLASRKRARTRGGQGCAQARIHCVRAPPLADAATSASLQARNDNTNSAKSAARNSFPE